MTAKRLNLTRDAIIDKALDLIEQDGLDRLSTRALGKSLGVQAMSLYHYVPSKDALLDDVTARLAAMIVIPEPSENWRGDLETIARSYIAIARTHPRAYPLLAGRRFNSRETLPILEQVFSIFGAAGLPPDGIAAAFRLLGYFMNGAGMAEMATREATRRSDFQLPDPDFLADYPLARQVVPHLALDELNGIFEKGLKAILDSIENDPARKPKIAAA
ncbi:TetR/AcrR family transcriptional regulator C-terminal domain-containing protein [Bradyrhizobium ontarionense]|uniref:TetR/AcrR family transcriptional regulator C-terminal domain-containing protein n=1 Tax=Bradyrhizobium ontarionense TaxID=2898149 RepID=A0ABY3RD72_9BRAD|nr:TetR/AcrR family transcriptional regulator C-terminal domain-containing protein [Bradyrhizobium sp. A19]UFZ05057.1 TetR/AcrR family transcriptional regulator C-terminal domain-containing protein [Bradyrhizobium sp. A19]